MSTTDMYLNVSPQELLDERASGYQPDDLMFSQTMSRARPIFNFSIIEEMVMDPRVMFGLSVIKGPIIAKTRFGVKAEDEEVQNYIIAQINRFWNGCIAQILEGIEWGFSSHEVVYEKDEEGSISLKGMNTFKSKDVRIVTKKGVRTGIKVDNVRTYGYSLDKVYLGGPKHFHYVHWRKYNKHYGRSRLWSVLVPYWEMWAKGGYRDIRRLWFGKNAFQGGMVRYPKGSTNVPGKGMVENHALALEMATKIMTGGVVVAPSSRTGMMKEGEWDWMFEPAKANSIPAGLLEYGGLLRIEVLEAMGVPYEVVEASGNEGFGSSSGRSVPLEVYYSILHEICQDIITDFKYQIMPTLLKLRYGRVFPFEVIPMPIQTNEQEAVSPSTNSEDDAEQSDSVDGKPKDSESSSEIEKKDEKDIRNKDREGIAQPL